MLQKLMEQGGKLMDFGMATKLENFSSLNIIVGGLLMQLAHVIFFNEALNGKEQF